MNVNGLLTKCWLSHLESNQNSGYQKPVCSRYTMGQAESRILYHISFAHRPVRMHLMRCGLRMLICLPTCLYGAFSFVVFALADSSSSRLTTCDRSLSVNAVGAFRVAHAPDRFLGIANRSVIHPRPDDQTNQREAKSQKEYKKDSRLQTHAPRAGKMLGPEILGLLCSIPHEELLAAALACL